MPKIIKQSSVVDDNWQIIDRAHQGDLPQGNLLIHISLWQSIKDSVPQGCTIAPWFDSDDSLEGYAADIHNCPLVAINFPVFMDGRGFSLARELRERYGYKGELRAIGEVIQDQLFFLHRCGFDAYDLRPETHLETAVKSLQDFTVRYQPAIDTAKPLFRQR
jgi:uncharacterized protein (DUF934 family)